MDVLQFILSEITIGAMVIGATTYIGKTAISHFFERDARAYKSELDEKTAIALASYQATLEIERIRLQITYGGIYEKQAETILDLYRLLTRFERLMNLAAYSGKDSVEYSEFIEVWEKPMEVYEERQVLLPENVDSQIGDIAKAIFSAVQDIRRAEDRIGKIGHTLSQKQVDALFASQDKAAEIMNRIPELRADLKTHMRKLLGVHHAQS